MKKKLMIGDNILDDIKTKCGFTFLEEEANRGFRDFRIGDFIINNHGTYGFIKDTYSLSRDARVHVGSHIEVSCTGDDGYDTLEINGFHVFKVK